MASIKANETVSGRKTYTVSYRDAAKKLQQETFKKKADADRRKAEIELALHSGAAVSRITRITLAEYAERWLASMSAAEGTKTNRAQRFRLWILPQLGATPLPAITPSQLKGWLGDLERAGNSRGYIVGILADLSTVLNAAVDDGLIPTNPARSRQVKAPRSTEAELELWSSDQIASVRDALAERWKVVVDLGTSLGLRPSETTGLAVEDVDFLRGVVHVRRQVQRVQYQPVFKLPKGEKVRDVWLPTEAKAKLASYLQRFPAKAVELPWIRPGGTPTSARLILTGTTGQAVSQLDGPWSRAVARVPGLDDVKTGPHQLRHWYASNLLARGISVVEVSKQLGHASPAITLGYYAHVMPNSEDQVRSAIDEALRASGF